MRFLATGTANVIPILKCILSLSLSHTRLSLIPILHLNIKFTPFRFNFIFIYIKPSSSPISPSSSSSLHSGTYFRPSAAALRDSQHSSSIRANSILIIRKMNHCGIHQKNTFASSQEEMRISFDNCEPVICPKPRRLSLFNTTANEPVKPLRWQMCYPSDGQESKAGSELLDIIFAKEGVYEHCASIASSPPFFSGSPPSRVSNPLTQDARFGDTKVYPISPRSMIPNPASSGLQSSPSARNGGCNRSSFGNKPAVRIEGFDCLDRDNRRNCSIPTLA